jgi:demethylspheroidene O-methyltransferase
MTLRDRWLARRDALLSSPQFRRWAAQFPPTRGIARRRAQRLFDLTAGFVYSQTLLASVRLRLFDILAEGPITAGALAERIGLPEGPVERLLLAAEALQLIGRRSSGRWGLGALGAPLAGNDALAAIIEHSALLYEDLADPVALLRQGSAGATRLQRYWSYAGQEAPAGAPADAVAEYSVLMARSVSLVAEEVVARIPLTEHRVLLDVGGGEGAFLQAAARRAPALGLMLVDLPAVAGRAEARLRAAGLGDRVRVSGTDFLRQPLPQGADLITLVRVLHDHDDHQASRLLGSCYDALPPGGRLVIAEPMCGVPGAPMTGPVYFGLYLLAMGSGRPRSATDYGALLAAAGFSRVSSPSSRTPVQTGLVVARRV